MSLCQSRDSEICQFLDWLDDDVAPEEGVMFLASPAVKNYWLHRAAFTLDQDKVLWKEVGEGSVKTRLLVVPEELRKEVLRLCHDVPAAGHQGIDRTKARLRDRFFWYGMMREAEQFVSTCGPCSRNKHPQRHARAEMIKYHAGAPMERVHLDFLGPLPRTKQGNEYVLVMVDQFTKWVECVPLPTQTAEATATAAVDQFFARFGYKAQNCWDEHLAQIAGALRSAVNRNTGFTANKLMLGREVNIPADLMYAPPQRDPAVDLEGYVVNLEKAIQSAHETARRRLRTSEERMKRDYDLKVCARTYHEGDLVYVLDTATVKGKSRKLSPSWKGPGIILKKLSSHLY
ncbi:uncharacterized protein LOC133174958 [Saccostrea echinata]|uniref:uncharacterized protein LOC133174958 n=1 Tax=Saccostrea echinata TaxID=191078 RepID=UPI002A8212AF|nr:uncharacterized protein LOC133174958 [Saccostrea echinata]